MNKLEKRILEISYRNKLSHIGSCLTSVNIIDEIYKIKKKDELFILSSGHAGVALYCVIEKYGGRNAEEIWKHHGTHPDRCSICGLDCSTGSLGQGLPIAVGMALADRTKNVYCIISDGECAEGSIYESAQIMRREKLNNLKLYLNYNFYGAYRQLKDDDLDPICFMLNDDRLYNQLQIRLTNVEQLPFLKGQSAHYHVMTKEEYEKAICG